MKSDISVYKKFDTKRRFKYPVIGLGAQAKSSLALGFKNEIYLSQPFADLSRVSEFKRFEKTLKEFIKFSGAKLFAYDLHPAYSYRELIYNYLENGFFAFSVQHHEAHIGACCFENNINSDIIGVAFDGTGFGSDARLWGGDFFVGNLKNFKRVAQIRYFPLVGGEAAILEPWRIAASLVYGIYRERFFSLKIDFVKMLERQKWQHLEKMLKGRINSPLTSSVGRLFDAVSALLSLVRGKIAYEAEGPKRVEELAGGFKGLNSRGLCYNCKIKRDKNIYLISPDKIISGIVSDLEKRVQKEAIAFKFHNSLARIILDTAKIIRRDTGLKKVVFSGGVFANKLLSRLAKEMLAKNGFEVFVNKFLGPSDANICLGQVVIARERTRSSVCA